MQSTDRFVPLRAPDGALTARVWIGTMEDGTPVEVYVPAIAIPSYAPGIDQAERELVPRDNPVADVGGRS